MDTHAKIYVAGHRGMVGSAIIRILNGQGKSNLIPRTHAELDLTNQAAVRAFFKAVGLEEVLAKAYAEYLGR